MNQEELQLVMPNATMRSIATFVDPINAAMDEFGIQTTEQVAAFLANAAWETGQLQFLAEIWGPTTSQKRYEPPSSLARILGNKEPGDGKLFRGRGLLMLTGRDNYARASEALGVDLIGAPGLVASDPLLAARTAGWFWSLHDLNTVADMGNFRAVVIAINGGINGLEYRQQFYDRAMETLSA